MALINNFSNLVLLVSYCFHFGLVTHFSHFNAMLPRMVIEWNIGITCRATNRVDLGWGIYNLGLGLDICNMLGYGERLG